MNLITVIPRGGRRLPFPVPSLPVLSEDLYVCCIGHAFGLVPPDNPGDPPVYFVQDFLVDQSQSTGGGSFMADPVQFDLTRSAGYMYRIFSSCGKHFSVKLPAGASGVSFSAWLGRQSDPSSGGFFSQTPAHTSFEGLVGTAPVLTYNYFFVTQTDNSALEFEVEGDVNSSFQFDGITLRADFSRTVDPGARWYSPLSYAVPLGTKDIYPKSETFVMFAYQTSNPVDPGPFVTLV